jgi:DNA invertase Pin-like site-specific DNA recombinase
VAKAYGYCRASTAGQHYTFEAQRQAISTYYDNQLKGKGIEFGGWFEDHATSGEKPLAEREGGRALWATVQPGDCVIWSKLDRAFRNVVDGANTLNLFAARGISVHSLDIQLDTSSSLGRFVVHLLVLLGELERDWIRTRTREALAIRQAKGLPHGGRPPAGWRQDPSGHWAPDDAERALVDWAIVQHDQGGFTWTQIVSRLKQAGARRANGDRYHQPWFHYAIKARAAGYPGRDGWREQCAFGGSVRREGKAAYRAKATKARRLQACPDNSAAIPGSASGATPLHTDASSRPSD